MTPARCLQFPQAIISIKFFFAYTNVKKGHFLSYLYLHLTLLGTCLTTGSRLVYLESAYKLNIIPFIKSQSVNRKRFISIFSVLMLGGMKAFILLFLDAYPFPGYSTSSGFETLIVGRWQLSIMTVITGMSVATN